jgi:hypothetical protein
MPGHRDVWRSEPDGSGAADVGALRLAVRPPGDARGPVRFVVQRREGGDRPHASVGSGTEPDASTAMNKAARMADGLVEAPGMRPFLSGRCSAGKAEGAPCAS